MASYTAPTTRTSGDLVTAGIWNTDLVENIKYLKDAPTFAGLVTLGAGQVAFPASQNASSDAHTLDDYEEGTWTPAIGGSTSESGQAYSSRVGRYRKVGKTVCVDAYLEMSTKGTITGTVVVKGLPFVVANIADYNPSAALAYWDNLTTSCVFVGGIGASNASYITLYKATAAAGGLSTVASGDLSNTTSLSMSLVYETDN